MDLGSTRNADFALIAHVTDTHLFASADGTLLGVNTAQSLARVLADIKNFPESVDCIVVTGDLVHDETAAGYRRFRAMFERLGLPVCCLAGNHDEPALLRREFDEGLVRAPPFFALGAWAFRLLHTPMPGHVAGALDDAELAALRAWVEQHPKQHIGLALHHHPLPVGSAWLDALALRNGADLIAEVARQSRIKLAYWGHVHQPWDESRDDCRWLSTPSTCAQFKPNSKKFALDAPVPAWRWIRCRASGEVETGIRYITQ